MTRASAPTPNTGGDRRWSGQDGWAIGLRIGLAVLPSALALIAVITTMRLFPETETRSGALLSIISSAAVGFLVAWITNRFTVRMLPLAALLRLSLVFPDQAPSRIKLAIRASSPKRLRAEVESARHHGLSSDTTEAAGQVLLLTTALGEHDRRTRGHSERVRLFARLLGEEMGVHGDDLERLQWGALLHDIGKLTIPTDILNKPGKLDETEWAIMSGHAAAGRDLAAPLQPFLGGFVAAADGHHEKWDGSGYPRGLRGTEIPLPARIVAVADAYEVMTATRAYKKPMSAEAARAELTACAGKHFDPDVVRAWLRVSVGDVNRAAGPAAFIAGLPLVGDVIAMVGRTASTVSAIPGAVASAAPAAATAGAMTMAVVAAPTMATSPELALDLRSEITNSRPAVDLFESTTSSMASTTQPPTTERPITTAPSTQTSMTEAPTTIAPTSTAVSITVAATSATTAAPTTARTAPTTSTTAAPITATTSTTAAPTTTSTTAAFAGTVFTGSSGAALTAVGPIQPGADLSQSGPFGGGTYLFQEAPRTLAADLDVNGTTLAAGSVVCVHLFMTAELAGDPMWRIDYDRNVLAVTESTETLVATDFLHGGGSVDYGTNSYRGISDDDDVRVIANGRRVRLKLTGSYADSVRIFIDCTP